MGRRRAGVAAHDNFQVPYLLAGSAGRNARRPHVGRFQDARGEPHGRRTSLQGERDRVV